MESESNETDRVQENKTVVPVDLVEFMADIFESDKIRFRDYLLKKIQSTST